MIITVKVAIVCEYNPFHNGHKEQIDFVRDRFSPEEVCVVCIMSGNYVQRGDIAVAQKYKRAEWAVKSGADLVLELPFPWSLGMAEDFARGAVGIAHRLCDIDYLCFGSESGDIERIVETADNLLDGAFCSELALRVQARRERSYAVLREELYLELFGKELLTSPNDILALEYVKAIRSLGSHIKPLANRRTSDFSATASRKEILGGDAQSLAQMIPKAPANYFEDFDGCSLEDLADYICLFYSLADPASFDGIYEMNFDLASKICSAAKECSSVQELTDRVCDKRYTRARVRRALICGILGVTKERMAQDAAFVTLLACSPIGREYLSSYKGALKVITRKAELGVSDGAASQYALSAKADMLYNRILSMKSVQIIKKPYICE